MIRFRDLFFMIIGAGIMFAVHYYFQWPKQESELKREIRKDFQEITNDLGLN